MNRKILILMIVAALIILGLIIFLILKTTPKKTVTTTEEVSTQSGKLEKALDSTIAFPYLIDDKFIISLHPKESYFQKFALTDKKEIKKYLIENLPVISSGDWSPSGDKILIFDNSKYFVFDLNSLKLYELDSRIKRATWVNNQKIIYHFLDNEISELDLSNFDGSNKQKLLDLKFPNLEDILAYYPEQDFIFILKAKFDPLSDVISINLKTGEQKVVIEDTIEASMSSKSSNFILFEKNNRLSLKNIKSNKEVNLDLISSVKNSVWSKDNKFLIISVSQKGKPDDIYKINLDSLEKKKINYGDTQLFNIADLMLDDSGNNLYFTSNELIYKLSLE